MAVRTRSPIYDALNGESYQYLSTQAPELLGAIEQEIAAGKTPHEIMRLIAQYVGPDRHALAVRAYQAASYVERMQRS